MALAAVCGVLMVYLLSSEVRYAFSSGVPTNVGSLSSFDAAAWTADESNQAKQYVEATATLTNEGAVRYSRPFEGDSFRLQPARGNDRVWVEIRVPEGMDSDRFVAPQAFTGRLVPLAAAGIRHFHAARNVELQTGHRIRPDALLLVDGASPRASRWAIALACLFTFFVGWSVFNIVRIVRPVS